MTEPNLSGPASPIQDSETCSDVLQSFSWLLSPGLMGSHLDRRIRPFDYWLAIDRVVTEAIHAGNGRVIITVPPRHGKSTLISHWLPVWVLEWFPHFRIGLATYSAAYARTWGRRVRNTIIAHESELSVEVAADAAQANSWATTAGGGMQSQGVGGAFTGFGFDVLIGDDLIKNAEQANSQAYLDKVWDWWTSTAYTRLEPGGTAILLMTRWSEKDLIGRLLKHQQENPDSERWTVINLPALAEENDPVGRQPGEALCPERYDVKALKRIKLAVGSRVWNSLYQQHDTPPEGGMFKRAWFGRFVDNPPAGGVRYWDLASTSEASSSDPDWTVGTRVVPLANGDVCIADVRRTRDRPAGVEQLIKATAAMDGPDVPIYIEQEGGASGKIVISSYQRVVLPEYSVVGVPPRLNKVVRAMPLSAAAERGSVVLARGAWNAAWIDELCTFPNGSHDDQVDSATGGYQKCVAGGGTLREEDLRKIFGSGS